jgi:16S rRNA (guanine(966)-N(2))-methyltransferase RsmD
MRIIAGTKRGLKLFSPKTTASRPITDRVKESLFNVLYNYGLPEGKIVADLFCGVGSLGLEALSRGAEFVTFVELDSNVVATLERNIEKAGFVRESKVIRANAFKIGAPAAAAAGISNLSRYDLVFVDPPYAFTENVQDGSPLSGLMDILGAQVSQDGIVVVRTNCKSFLLGQYGKYRLIERRQWGSMAVSILRSTRE